MAVLSNGMPRCGAWCFAFLLGVAVWASSCVAVAAQFQGGSPASEYTQRQWTREDGLPDDQVRAILQGDDGYLWIATRFGLARFDGIRFTVFNHLNTPEMGDGDCRALAKDSAGVLWVSCGTRLLRLTDRGFRAVAPGIVPGCDFAEALYADLKGSIWSGVASFVDQIRGDTYVRFDKAAGFPEAIVMAMGEPEAGLLWLGTLTGMYQLDPMGGRIQQAQPGLEFTSMAALAFCRTGRGGEWVLFSDLRIDPSQGWAGVNLWLQEWQDGRWNRVVLPATPDFVFSPPTAFIHEDRSGNVWLPAMENGVTRMRDGRFEHVPMPHTREHQRATCVTEDHEGNLWVGTASEGIQRWQPKHLNRVSTSDGLPDDRVWTLCEADDGTMWIGSEGGVSWFKDGQMGTIAPEQAISAVRSLGMGDDGTLWIGTGNGLSTWKDGQISSNPFSGAWYEGKIRVILPTKEGGVYVGTAMGLRRFQRGQWSKYTTADGLGANDVRTLLEDRSGTLWIGTAGGGLSCLRDGRFTTFSGTNQLSNNRVWALHEDAEGVLWIGTENGLNRLKDGHFSTFTTSRGLPDNLVNHILEDDRGWLWISHDLGVYRVRRQSLNQVALGKAEKVQCVQYHETEDQIRIETNGQKSQPAGCKTRDGRLWFPTMKGVLVIDPRLHREEECLPVSAIEEVRANGQVVLNNGPREGGEVPIKSAEGVKGVLQLVPGTARVLEVRYTASTFLSAEATRFRYRLRGLDDHWIEAGTRRVAYFTDLHPGDYELQVSAASRYGVWNEEGTKMPIRVLPFVYQTRWFALLTVLAAGGLIVTLVNWRMRELRRIHELERLHALDDQRRRIARDIHDEIGASLTHIVQLSQPAQQARVETTELEDRNRRIIALAEETVDRLGEVVWVHNPRYDTVEDTVSYLREYAAEYLAATPLEATFDFPSSLPAQTVDGMLRQHLLLVTKEALRNILRHAKASLVEFRLRVEEHRLELSIRDDGGGISDRKSGSGSNGLVNMRERITELGGDFEVVSQPGSGTTIRVSVPLRKN
jgi:ligand-binding sensor domain-containing protein/signal transduction histidine kinase